MPLFCYPINHNIYRSKSISMGEEANKKEELEERRSGRQKNKIKKKKEDQV